MPILPLPAIVRVLCAFAVMLLAIRNKVSLGSAFMLGALVLGILFGMGPWDLVRSMLNSLTEPKTLALAAIVSLILVFSHGMELAGQMQRLLDRFEGLITRPTVNLIIFPALIGLLPMPGGAIFSAPMVKTLGNRLALSGDHLSYVNYWFRHIWEYWWPLYPGVLLASALADLDLWRFVLFLFPLTLVALAGGYLPIKFERNGPTGDSPSAFGRPPLLPFFRELFPIAFVIVGGLAGGAALSALPYRPLRPVAKELGLIAALVAAIWLVWERNRISWSQRLKLLRNRQLLQMFFMVLAILVFKGVLEDSRAVSGISRELLSWNIPLASIAIVLPMLVGGVSGITIAFVGTTFPILIALVRDAGESSHLPAYVMLAMTSGFIGVLLSPIHLCLLLSNEYFGTSLIPVYRHLWRPALALLAASSLYFWGLLLFP